MMLGSVFKKLGREMITGLHHIAIAVPNFQQAIARFCEDLGCILQSTEDVAAAATKTAFLPIEDAQIELIHPLTPNSPVQKFLDKRGGGLHHLCFISDDLLADRDRLLKKGYEFIQAEPQPGAHGSRVLWIHPKSMAGVLVELAEYPQ